MDRIERYFLVTAAKGLFPFVATVARAGLMRAANQGAAQRPAHAAAVSIERRITRCTSAFDRNRSWLTMPQPESDASITRTPSLSMAAFSAAPTRVIPPANRPDSASARSLV